MYVPTRFAETDPGRLRAFVREHSFGTLVTCPRGEGGVAVPFATHLPFVLDEDAGPHGTLRGHLARANPQHLHLEGDGPSLVVFSGPHAFVSSMWSADPANEVPTWSYVAVHAYGRARVLGDEAAFGVLAALMAAHQPEHNPVPLDPPAPLAQTLVSAIVAFEITVERWEGKAKLGQNRTPDDRLRIEDALRARGGLWDGDIADRMRALRAAAR